MSDQRESRKASDTDSGDERHEYNTLPQKPLFPDPKRDPVPNVAEGLEVLYKTTALYVTSYPTNDPGQVHKYAISDETGAQILLAEETRKRRTDNASSQSSTQRVDFLVFNHRGRTLLTIECQARKSCCSSVFELSGELRSTQEHLGKVIVKNHIFPGEVYDCDGQKRLNIGTSHVGVSRLPWLGICALSPTKGADAEARRSVYLKDCKMGNIAVDQFLIEDTPGIHVGIKVPAGIEPELKAVLLTYLLHYHIWLIHHQEQHPILLRNEERRPEDFLPYLTLDALSTAPLNKGKSITSFRSNASKQQWSVN